MVIHFSFYSTDMRNYKQKQIHKITNFKIRNEWYI